MKTLLSLLFCCPLLLAAQGFTGTITSARTGEPLPYASIYVKETGSGTVTNEDGRYQLKLGGGNYTLVFQYLGYTTDVRNVRSGGGYQTLNVELTVEALDLEVVEVIDGGEDASYSVIRRAIAKADYHLNQVDSYSAQVYIRGTGKVNKIPGLIMKMVPKEDREDIDTTQAFVTESVSKIEYKRPNTFSQEVLSKYEFGEFGADATPYLFGTFYQPEIAGAISPLNIRAFSYYRFEHQGLFVDRDRFVNKIKVTPRSKGEDVFSGFIYILQDDWSIHSLDLELYKVGFKFNIRQTYAPVQDKAWMTVSTNVDVIGKIMGIELQGHYISTISDYDLRLNPDLPGYVEVIDEKTAPEKAAAVVRENRNRDYEQRLEEGGELTRKEMLRLMRSYQKEERKQAEEPEVVNNYSYKEDSATVVRDTTQWAQLRPVPLTPLEQKSYALQDSLVRNGLIERDTTTDIEDATVELTVGSGGVSDVSFGGKKKFLNFMPNLDILNAVEGYSAGLRIGHKKYKEGRTINYGITPRYGISWKRLSVKADYNYAKAEKGKLTEWRLEGGRFLRQFDPDEAMDPLLNTFAMLFSHENYLSLYERAYGEFSLKRTWRQDASFSAGLAYEDRRAVVNTTEAGLFNVKDNFYRPNTPFNAESVTSATILSPAATLRLGADWWPGQTYSVTNGKRTPVANSAPKLSLNYFGGFAGIAQSETDFHRLEAAYQHRFDLGIRGQVDLMVRGGSFLSRNNVALPDYKHFATTEIFYTDADPIGSYRLLPFYTFSTGQEYLEVYAHYQFRKLLLSRIWKLQRQGIREDVFVNYLYTPESEHYTELGYTIDNIFRFIRLEFVTSFQDFKYRDFGVRMSVASIFGRR